MKQKNDISHSELPLPRYVRDVLSKHNISLPSPLGEGAGVRLLALQSHRYPDIDMPYLLNQLTGWQTARTKLPSWAANEDIIYPPHLSMEQCSSEHTAEYKAQLVSRLIRLSSLVTNSPQNEQSSPSAVESATLMSREGTEQKGRGGTFCDLTGGFGVDFSFISRRFERALFMSNNRRSCAKWHVITFVP